MKQVKLVVWDLDDTFWHGVLSEGPIRYSAANHDMVIELARRGIMSSICSKNTFADARHVLSAHGIWDYFVFPKIEWLPKGQLIAAIIREMQLRAENVLFIDDNPLNLEEAKYYNPGLQTSPPDILERLLSLGACAGKDDRELSRLRQYRVLEKKAADLKASQGSNEAFLRSSAIRVQLSRDCLPEAERLLELINRTNQLNYTKRRVQHQELAALLEDERIDKALVRVTDKYGDYGICGFYALERNRLLQFVFSCRIMNMGIENWLYQRLGCPELEIAGEVATPLTRDGMPDWVSQEDHSDVGGESADDASRHNGQSMVIKGGCDLLQIKNYLTTGSLFEAETDYVSAGGYRINNSHSEILKRCQPATLADYGDIIDRLHFFDRHAFTSRFFESTYNIHIYSVLDDYTRGLYRYRDTDFIIPFGDLSEDLTDVSTWDYHQQRSAKHRLDKPFLQWFGDNFSFLGGLQPEAFQKNIAWICSRIAPDGLLIILNGSEVEYYPFPQERRWERHRAMNAALADVIQDQPQVVLCDVRDFVRTPADHSHNIRHYSRKVYYQIASRINEIVGERCQVSPGFWARQRTLLKNLARLSAHYTGRRIRGRFLAGTPPRS